MNHQHDNLTAEDSGENYLNGIVWRQTKGEAGDPVANTVTSARGQQQHSPRKTTVSLLKMIFTIKYKMPELFVVKPDIVYMIFFQKLKSTPSPPPSFVYLLLIIQVKMRGKKSLA